MCFVFLVDDFTYVFGGCFAIIVAIHTLYNCQNHGKYEQAPCMNLQRAVNTAKWKMKQKYACFIWHASNNILPRE